MSNKKVVLVIGAGDATGGAIARRFAREGYVACVTRRSADKLQPLMGEAAAAHADHIQALKASELPADKSIRNHIPAQTRYTADHGL